MRIRKAQINFFTIVSFILGILSIVISLIPFFGVLALLLCISGGVISVLLFKRDSLLFFKNKMAITAVILLFIGFGMTFIAHVLPFLVELFSE